MMCRILSCLLLVGLLAATPALAQNTVLLVRHAERADDGMAAPASADPDLSDAGLARAKSLAAMLKDAAITEIFVTEFKRTRQTAEPLAKLLALTPTVVSSKDTTGLFARVKAAKGNVLVVGHSNSIPVVMKSLGVTETVTIGETDYDNLFVVSRGANTSMVRLRYR